MGGLSTSTLVQTLGMLLIMRALASGLYARLGLKQSVMASAPTYSVRGTEGFGDCE
jgi:hypothetical protein